MTLIGPLRYTSCTSSHQTSSRRIPLSMYHQLRIWHQGFRIAPMGLHAAIVDKTTITVQQLRARSAERKARLSAPFESPNVNGRFQQPGSEWTKQVFCCVPERRLFHPPFGGGGLLVSSALPCRMITQDQHNELMSGELRHQLCIGTCSRVWVRPERLWLPDEWGGYHAKEWPSPQLLAPTFAPFSTTPQPPRVCS